MRHIKQLTVGNNIKGNSYNLCTHDGGIHADEVISTVILIMYHLLKGKKNVIHIVRTRDMKDIGKADIVYDVGGGRFDHHQGSIQDLLKREDGSVYASCGLIWKEYGMYICKKLTKKAGNPEQAEDLFRAIDKEYIEVIDAADNGQSYKGKKIFKFILYFSTLYDEENMNDNFLNAVKKSYVVFEKLLDKKIHPNMDIEDTSEYRLAVYGSAITNAIYMLSQKDKLLSMAIKKDIKSMPYDCVRLWMKYGKEICKLYEEDINIIDTIYQVVSRKIREGNYNIRSGKDIGNFLDFLSLFSLNNEELDKASVVIKEVLHRFIINVKVSIHANNNLKKLDIKKNDRYIVCEDVTLKIAPYSVAKLNKNYGYDIDFILSRQSTSNEWNIRCVPSFDLETKNRINLPEKWRGKEGKELEEVIKIKGCVFCHPKGFQMIVKSKETAIAVIEKILSDKDYLSKEVG